MHLQAKKKIAKGRELELRIERVFHQLENLPGILPIRIEVRQARLRGEFVYCRKQPFDYLLMTKRGVFAFDAKECCAEVFYPSRIPQHQKQSLEKMMGFDYGQAAFVVWFRGANRVDRIRWITDFANPATVDSGIPFDWEIFL